MLKRIIIKKQKLTKMETAKLFQKVRGRLHKQPKPRLFLDSLILNWWNTKKSDETEFVLELKLLLKKT